MADSAESPSTNRAAWQNFWQGSANGAALPVVLDLAERLQPVWKERFDWLQAESLVAAEGLFVELACGARPVIAGASLDPGRCVLHDGSRAALAEAAGALPLARSLCSELARVDLPDASTALTVSQFGLEYGGSQAMAELERITQNNGLLVAVVHKAPGAIEQASTASKTLVESFLACETLKVAPDLFRAAFDHHAGRIDDAGYLAVDGRFAPLLAQTKELLRSHARTERSSAALQTLVKIVQDMGQLHSRFGEYRLDDLLGWLAGWQQELRHYVARLDSMLAAAVDEATLKQRLASWQAVTTGVPLYTPLEDPDGREYAWLICARWVR